MQRRSKLRKSAACGSNLHLVQALEGRLLMSASAPTMHTTFEAFKPHGLSANSTYSSPPSFAISPTEMRGYYGIDTILYGNTPGDGRGMTIAIVDAFDDPNLQSDLNAFDQQYNLPALAITKYSQTGSTTLTAVQASQGTWGIETSLDVEWAHVISPLANIIVVEGNSAVGNDLFAAAQSAAGLPNVAVVSMSFGAGEFSGEQTWDGAFTTPSQHTNVTFVASTGDAGSPAEYPGYSPNVIAVGGTTFTFDSNSNINGEVAWNNSGGGTSAYEPEPSYQDGVQSTGLRTAPDVSMDANPSTGVAIYDSYDFGATDPWAVYGGTSLAAPMFAGVIAIADQGRVQNNLSRLDGASQTLPMLYGLKSADFHDITSGSNGGFTASVGYDEVTGRGSPNGSVLPNDLAGILPNIPLINDATANDTITLTEDPDQLYIDWTSNTSSGQFAITDPAGLRITGTGNTTIQFNYAHGNPVPRLMDLFGTFTLSGLQGTNPLAGSRLDINSSTLFIMYSPGSDPITAVQQYLHTGYNGGLWNGTPVVGSGSIMSSTAAADSAHLHAIGYVDSADGSGYNATANSIEVKYTLYGDTALVGSVGFTDFMRMTQHYTQNTGGTWDTGDFNYDGSINSADFNLLQPAYGLSLATSPGPLPDLSGAAAASVAATGSGTPTSTSPDVVTVPTTPATSIPRTIPANHPRRTNANRHCRVIITRWQSNWLPLRSAPRAGRY